MKLISLYIILYETKYCMKLILYYMKLNYVKLIIF